MLIKRRDALRPDAISSHQDSFPTADDHELMVATTVGDVQAFAVLMERHLGGMVALALRITGNASDADEVAQEGFLRLWKRAPQWDPDGAGSVRTWLTRVIVNLCLDRRRRRLWVALEEAGELVDTAVGAFESKQDADKKRVIQGLLQKLPLRQRTAVVLSYFEELSGEQIAKSMGLSVGAVESLLVRARRTLKQGIQNAGFIRGEDI